MAISPKSKGLGNIGNIVNRQGMAAPTSPAAAKPVAPVTNRATTTFAQRQASQPFRNYTKPAAPITKVNPMANQPVNLNNSLQPTPQPFNPNPNPGQAFDLSRFFGGNQQGPIFDMPNAMDYPVMNGPSGGMFGNMFNQGPNQMSAYAPGQGMPMNMFDTSQRYDPNAAMNPNNSLASAQDQQGLDWMNQNQGQLQQMFGNTATPDNFNMSGTVGNEMAPGMYNLQNAFNPTSNTNSSNSGSLFSGNGFANQ